MPDLGMRYSVRPYAGLLWRMLEVPWQRDPLSGEGSRRYGGRWNLKGWPALYLATEYHRPGTLVPFRVEATTIVDLTTGEARADDTVVAALACDWKTIALIAGQIPASWDLAQRLIATGAEGALVPSTQNRDGTNLVLWRWHDSRSAGKGARLTLLDPDRVLTGDSA